MTESYRDIERELVVLNPESSAIRGVLFACFLVWGFVGFFAAMLTWLISTVTAGMWFGGMLFFGLATLMCPLRYRALYAVRSALPEYPQVHNGFPCRLEPDRAVVAMTSEGPVRFENWSDFHSATLSNKPRRKGLFSRLLGHSS